MRGDQRADMSLMTFGGKTNMVLELGKRLLQPEEEWQDKCAAFVELQGLLSDFSMLQKKLYNAPETVGAEGAANLFTPENVQALTQPFRVTVTDLRSTVVKEACITLSLLAQALGPLRCKIFLRNVFPTLLDARGGSNKVSHNHTMDEKGGVNTAAVHSCIETIVQATPSRFVLAPILQVLDASKNRDVRESCIHYTNLALRGWNSAVLEKFRMPLQTAIVASLSDASPKGREKARDCYWNYIAIWPEDNEKMDNRMANGVKKHLKRSLKEAICGASRQTAKRRQLATITNTVDSESAAKIRFSGDNATHADNSVVIPSKQSAITSIALCNRMLLPQGEELPTQALSHWKSATSLTNESNLPSQISLTPIVVSTDPCEVSLLSQLVTPRGSQLSGIDQTESMHQKKTDWKDKIAQLQKKNALLARQVKAKTHELEKFHEKFEIISEQNKLFTSRQNDGVVVDICGHPLDAKMQSKNQSKAAEQFIKSQIKFVQLRNRLSPISSPMQLSSSAIQYDTPTDRDLPIFSKQQKSDSVTTANVKASEEAGALRSEESVLKEHMSVTKAQLVTFQAQQNAVELHKHMSSREAYAPESGQFEAKAQSSEKSGQSEAMANCSKKDERILQLESELFSLSELLQAITANAEASDANAGNELLALQSKISLLEEQLSAKSVHQEKLLAEQNEFENEKRLLLSEISALKSGQAKTMANFSKNDERMVQFETESSALSKQLQAVTAKAVDLDAKAGDELRALQSEESLLEEHVSSKETQQEKLLAKQNEFAEAKRVLLSEVSALKNSQPGAMVNCSEKDERIMQLKIELFSLSELLQASTAKAEVSYANAGSEMLALQSENPFLEEHFPAKIVQEEKLLAKENRLEKEKRLLLCEISALKSGQSETMTKCIEKDEQMRKLETRMSILSEQLQTVTAKAEASDAKAGDELRALQSEKSLLEEHLSAKKAQEEMLLAKQNELEKEKRILFSEVSTLKSGQSETIAQCIEKDERMVKLETEMSILSGQLQAVTAKAEASAAKTGDELRALQSEKCLLEEHLSAKKAQEEKLLAKQNELEKEKHLLFSEISALKSGQFETIAQCIEKDERMVKLDIEMSILSEQLQAVTAKAEASAAKTGDEFRALQSEKSLLEEHLSAKKAQEEKLLAKQNELEKEKHLLFSEVSALKSGQSETIAQCIEKDERMVELEIEMSILSELLQAVTAKAEASAAKVGDELRSLQSEKCLLEEHLSAKKAQEEKLLAKQNELEKEKHLLFSEVSALKSCQSEAIAQCIENVERMVELEIEMSILSEQLQAVTSAKSAQQEKLLAKQIKFAEEKRLLCSEIIALKSGQSELMAKCSEKDERMLQLKNELSSLFKQLQAALGEVEALDASARDEACKFRSEKSVLEISLSANKLKLDELQAMGFNCEETIRVLLCDISSIKRSRSEAIARCCEKNEEIVQLKSMLSSLSMQLQAATAKLEAAAVKAGKEISALQSEKSALENRLSAKSAQLQDLRENQLISLTTVDEKRESTRNACAMTCIRQDKLPKLVVPSGIFSLSFARDRSEVEAEKRQINEANLLQRRLRRQKRQ
ncbi:hypothetical protein CCR75_002837 [Bremia lactucae]|uniref:CLASP N-terminal domain-containing protein n=1 Tax=Bremia lactucae TaxID=4779 RepID=A0A976FJD9_BRELC|nr:hypothetical protein CCR75_002837 [Bremia lactucae]